MSGITASQIEAYGLPKRVQNKTTGSAPQPAITTRAGGFPGYVDTSPSYALLGILGVLVLIHVAVKQGARVD